MEKKQKTNKASEQKKPVSLRIDLKLWRDFKIACTRREVSIKARIEELIQESLGKK